LLGVWKLKNHVTEFMDVPKSLIKIFGWFTLPKKIRNKKTANEKYW
jgi:hypothetical protein